MSSDNDTKENLQSYLKKEILKDAKRLKNKYPAISEKVDGVSKEISINSFLFKQKTTLKILDTDIFCPYY